MGLIRALYIYCITLVVIGTGCVGPKQPLDGRWQVNESATLDTYQLRQGAFDVLPKNDPRWTHLTDTCFVIRDHAQLEVITPEGTKTVPIQTTETEPNLWKVSVDYAGYPSNIKAAQVGSELRILDAGYLFILENSCTSKR
jgi:hypothetical protein